MCKSFVCNKTPQRDFEGYLKCLLQEEEKLTEMTNMKQFLYYFLGLWHDVYETPTTLESFQVSDPSTNHSCTYGN